MELLPGLVLAEGETALPVEVTAAFAIAVAVVALLGRRGMPAGIGEGTFIAAVSGAAILLLAIDSAGNLSRSALGHVLTGLTALWYAAGRLAVRSAARVRPGSAPIAGSRDAAFVWAYAALVCGLAAAVNLVLASGGLASGAWSAGATDLVVLLVLSALNWVLRIGAWAPYPAIALLVCLLAMVVPASTLDARARAWGVGLNAAALLCLGVVIWTILLDWRRQRRQWLERPEWSADAPPARGTLPAVLVVVCVLIGLGGVLFHGFWFTPPALWLAALTCLTIGHARGWLLAGEIGLVLVGAGIVSASMAWLTPGWPGALFGLALAGGYLVWLARFWDQQLLDGVAWTTAGRLIPASRRLGYAASSGAIAATIVGLTTDAFTEQSLWILALTLLLLLVLMSLLVRDGLEFGQSGAFAASCLVTVAAAGPGCALFARLAAEPLMPIVAVAVGAMLLMLRVAFAVAGGRRPSADFQDSTAGAGPGRYISTGGPIHAAFVGGVLPVAVLFVLSWHAFTLQTVVGVAVTLVTLTVGGLVFRGMKRAGRGEAAD
ncbi:MAG: hypothetical protein KKI02_06560 [Planctomycetes bacterium]|nr:hypothetical protein [Planctomycetota bacterium]